MFISTFSYGYLKEEGHCMGNKVGRNNPCPCGSGLKYKRCCGNTTARELEQGVPNGFKSQSPYDDFPMLNEKVTKLKHVMLKYDFDDLVRAVFCINSFSKNRSAIESSLALNQVLVEYDALGNKGIKCYEEFSFFFNEIQDILAITPYDDFTTEDYGEVKLIWKNKHYGVIIGTGYEQTYGYYQFIPQAVNLNKSEMLYTELLEYISEQINFFKDTNISDGSAEVSFVLPKPGLFLRTHNYFDIFSNRDKFKEIINFFSNNNSNISHSHFVKHHDKSYPMFNTSILLDFYSQQLTNKSEKQIVDIIDLTIINLISKLAKLQDPKRPSVLYPVALVDDKEYLTKVVHAFLFMTKDGVIVGINGGRNSKKETDEEIKLINRLHNDSKLMFSEDLSKDGTKEKIGIRIGSEQKVKIFVYENIADPTFPNLILKEANKNYLQCLAVDIIYLLSFMDDIDEISRFYDHKMKSTSQTMSYGGISDYYFTWKESDEIIEKGAVNYSMISIMHGNSDGYVYDYFKEKLPNYPSCDNDSLFDNFHVWKIKPKENGFFEYVNKINRNFGGDGHTYLNNCFVFFVHNVEFYRMKNYSDKVIGLISLIDDLNLRNAGLYNDWFQENKYFNNKIIQFMFMPIEYAKSVDHSGFTKESNRKYVYSDMLLTENKVLIRYAVKEEQLYIDLEKATDRGVEATYYLELLKPLEKVAYYEYQELSKSISEEIHLPKGVGVASISIEYKWSDNSLDYYLHDKAYHLVRKEIAKLCKMIGIESGEYKGKETNKTIRTIQAGLINYFEKYVTRFDMFELHKELLSIYSKSLHNINIHKKRYGSFVNIDEFELIKVQDRTIELREKEKHHLRVIDFALETNLNIEINRGKSSFARDELEFILAFSNWLVVLFDTADICHKSEVDKHINVRHDFVIEIIDSEEMMNGLEGMSKRVYDNNDYSIKSDVTDKQYLKDAISCFKTDTGIDFTKLLNLLDFLTLVYSDQFAIEIHPNVYSAKKDDLISCFKQEYEGEIDSTEAISIIDYLIIEPKKLKLWKDRYVDFLPINERENRDNRFNLKPIVEIDEQLVFSPSVMNDLHKRWKFGITDFYLPYEIGLDNTVDCILEWKKRYEDLIVDDVAEVFVGFGVGYLWKEAWLHKLDKSGSHPVELGDYDILAYDDSRNILWVIECKVLNKVGSIHENYMQQYHFFLNKKLDEKFQRRIDYINMHYSAILEAQKIQDYGNVIIKPFMITNKVFFSRYKEIGFEIVTFHEFRQVLDNTNKM